MGFSRLRTWALVLTATLGVACASTGNSPAKIEAPVKGPFQLAATDELRGVWITNVDSDVLKSRKNIAEAMDYLASININVVYPVVWNQGVTLYPSDTMEREFGTRIHPAFDGRDPLAEIVVEAHRVGIEVVPWFEFGFASAYKAEGGAIIKKRPEWAAIGPDGKLVTKNGFDWMNALDPEVQDFVTSLVVEVATKYDVDGVQGDDRLPAMPTMGGYDAKTVARYKKEFGAEPPKDIKDPKWVQWRADILTDYLVRLRRDVKVVDPNLVVSSAPSYWDWARDEYLQDSKTWTDKGLVETLHPQAYRYDLDAYKKIIDDVTANQISADDLPVFTPGILIKLGKYRIPKEYFAGAIEYNRSKGIRGEVFFFYPGLRENENELGTFLKEGPYAKPATLFYRKGETWRPKAIVEKVPGMGVTGNWQRAPQFETIYQARGGEPNTFVDYGVTVPAAGTYDVFMELHAGPNHTTNAAVLINGKESAIIDQSKRENSGWVSVGQVRLDAGKHEKLIRLDVREASNDRVTFAGPVMLLLNRRLSPDTVWPKAGE